jgi:hypothetical protein
LNLKGQTLDEIFDVFEICPFSGTMFCDSQWSAWSPSPRLLIHHLTLSSTHINLYWTSILFYN